MGWGCACCHLMRVRPKSPHFKMKIRFHTAVAFPSPPAFSDESPRDSREFEARDCRASYRFGFARSRARQGALDLWEARRSHRAASPWLSTPVRLCITSDRCCRLTLDTYPRDAPPLYISLGKDKTAMEKEEEEEKRNARADARAPRHRTQPKAWIAHLAAGPERASPGPTCDQASSVPWPPPPPPIAAAS